MVLKAPLLWKVYMAAVADSGGHSAGSISLQLLKLSLNAGTISPATGQAKPGEHRMNTV